MKPVQALHASKRALAVALASGALVLGGAGVADAQEPSQELAGSSAGLVLGYDIDREFPLIGVDGRFTFPVAPRLALSFNPAINYFFTGSSDFFGGSVDSMVLQFDANALLHLALDSVVNPYVGAGVAVLNVDTELVDANDNVIASESETSVGANVILGTSFDTGSPVTPYIQGRMTFDEISILGLMLGVNYDF